MKRGIWLTTIGLAVALAVGALALADGNEYGPGWRHGPGMMGGGYGPGMMWGGGEYGPGMMGGGYGPGMMWGGGYGGMMGFGMGPALAQLPADKQEQLRKLQVNTGQAMVAMMADMQAKGEALREAMAKFPVDQAAAKKAHDAMGTVRDQMFALHLAALAQAQQIIGKDLWDDLQTGGWGPGYGRGYGPGAGRGPGMMGPGGGPNR